MIHPSIASCIGNTPLVRLARLFPDEGVEVLAKLEYLNPGGSVKDRPARFIVEQGLANGSIPAGSRLVESTSGNFGVALAMVARLYGLKFTAVIDVNTTSANLALLRTYGADVEIVDIPDRHAGYLVSRLARVAEILAEDPAAIWINQYANELNWRCHFESTGPEIVRDAGSVDILVSAVSTTGTILGISRFLRQVNPATRVVAVDAVGSIIFGGKPGPRAIPGIGASRVPEILSRTEIDDVVYVSDQEAVAGCRDLLAAEGILAGGSSGSIVVALQKIVPAVARPARIVTIFPDRGERYLESVYESAIDASHAGLTTPGGGLR